MRVVGEMRYTAINLVSYLDIQISTQNQRLFCISRPSSRSSVRSDRSDRPSSRAGQRSKQPVLGVGTLAYQPQLFDEDPGGYLV